jgi:hypothetical protein
MSKRVPAKTFLDTELLCGWSDDLTHDCLSPIWLPSSMVLACEDPVIGLSIGAALPPLGQSISKNRMHGHGLLRRFGFASSNHAISDRTCHVHRPDSKIDVIPLQSEQLSLSQASRRCEENQRSLSNIQTVGQCPDFGGQKHIRGCQSFRTLTNEAYGIAIKQLVRQAWLKSTDIKFRILAHVLLASGKPRSQDSTSVARTSPSSYFPHLGMNQRFRQKK